MRRTCLTVIVLVGCADEGITHIAGPFPVQTADAGKTVDARAPAKKDADVATEEEPATTEEDASAPPEDASEPPEDAAKVDELPPCPTGYACMDPAGPLAAMGLSGTITDPDGNQVAFSCAKGGQETCDPKDPRKSCPNFSKPYCAHLKLSGLLAVELDQCAQDCTP